MTSGDMEIASVSPVVVGINGPLSDAFISSVKHILPYESVFFDKSYIAKSESSGSRLTLENRYQAVQNPAAIRDNLVGGLDMFEYEMKCMSFVDGPAIICLHSNDILLNSSRENIDRFKAICKQYSGQAEIVLSIGLPQDVLADPIGQREKGVEYLVSHVHYGSSGGLLFGMMGPIEKDRVVEIYKEAHSRTGAPILINSALIDVAGEKSFPTNKAFIVTESVGQVVKVIESINAPPNQCMNFVVPTSIESLDPFLQVEASKDESVCIIPTVGCEYKVDFKKFGGSGFSLGHYTLSNIANIITSLSFAWDPPKLDGKQDDDYGIWVCDICGLVAKLSEKENYTKHGFTYCSISCLAAHRKKGFAPLAG